MPLKRPELSPAFCKFAGAFKGVCSIGKSTVGVFESTNRKFIVHYNPTRKPNDINVALCSL